LREHRWCGVGRNRVDRGECIIERPEIGEEGAGARSSCILVCALNHFTAQAQSPIGIAGEWRGGDRR
jgi:hypothetical protein